MTEKGAIKKVFRMNTSVITLPRFLTKENPMDEDFQKLQVFRGEVSNIVHSVTLPVWFT